MPIQFGLKESTLRKIQEVFFQHPQIDKAILYGSRAKGNYQNGSDIDLVLVGGEDLDLEVLLRVMREIDDLLLPYQVDLAILQWIDDPDVLEHIRRVGIIFYDRQAIGCLKDR
jgi:predicted nucleotidyltransferase